jgi:3-hydroxyisobutyrate dehydrogenase-like beta-hydroxyacid dehydrogenase
MYRVGMIGLGKMGLPIARNLVERGFQIIGYRRSGSPELAALGGTVAGSPAEVAGHADILLSILPNDQSVTEADMSAPVFLAAKAVFDKAAADGWEELDIACVHDQLSGESSPGELA